MNVAVLGAGQWGKNLVKEFHRLGRLGAVVDPDVSKHAALSASYPGTPILRDRADLKGLPLSAVAIATPVPSHLADIHWALDENYDVFVEKPMVASLAEARTLGARLEKSDRLLMVGHLLLYQPAMRWITSFLKEGGLGQLVSVRQRRMNHGRIRRQENVLWSLGVHDIAVILHLLQSTPLEVRAFGHAYYQPRVEDEVTLNLRFPGNLDVSLEVSWIWPVRERTLTLIGTKGILVFDEIKQNITLYKKSFNGEFASQDGGTEVVFEQKEEALPFELQHFLDCLDRRQTPLSDFKNGFEVISVLERAAQALVKGK